VSHVSEFGVDESLILRFRGDSSGVEVRDPKITYHYFLGLCNILKFDLLLARQLLSIMVGFSPWEFGTRLLMFAFTTRLLLGTLGFPQSRHDPYLLQNSTQKLIQ
jgi:hypothetical protein